MISSLGIKSNHHDPESSITHEDESGTPNSSSCEDDQLVAKIFTRSINGFPEDCEAHVKDDDNHGNDDIELPTNDSSSEDEISASKEHASRMPSEDTENNEDTPNTPKKIVETARTTRSGTRFSDETNMLRDFLSRAQARKAAKDVSGSTEAPGSTTSCRRSPSDGELRRENRSRRSGIWTVWMKWLMKRRHIGGAREHVCLHPPDQLLRRPASSRCDEPTAAITSNYEDHPLRN